MGPFEELLAKGQRAADAGQLELAGRYFASAAGIALDAGHEEVASRGYLGAGDLFRRADAPNDAANSLHLALAVPASETTRGPARVMLAGVLTSISRFDAAAQQCALVEGPARTAALDSLCSIALARGDHDAFAANLQALEGQEGAPAAMATQLRTATLHRLQGDLTGAEQRLLALEPHLSSQPGGQGMVWAERGELALLRGEEDAAALWMRAKASFTTAKRRSLELQAELGRVRSLLQLGLTPLDHQLDEGLLWAEDRGLSLLALDLRRVSAWMREDVEGLDRAREAALELGLRPRAGKAELWRGELLVGAAALGPLQRAVELLEGDVPYQLLARTGHAEALAQLSPAAGRNAAGPLLALAEQTGMEGVQARLRTL